MSPLARRQAETPGTAHTREDVFHGKNRRCPCAEEIVRQADRALKEQRLSCLRDRLVSAHVIEIRAGIDHVADWHRAQLLDRVNHCRRAAGRPRIDDDCAVLADLYRHIAARPGEQVKVGAQLEHLEFRRPLPQHCHHGGDDRQHGCREHFHRGKS